MALHEVACLNNFFVNSKKNFFQKRSCAKNPQKRVTTHFHLNKQT